MDARTLTEWARPGEILSQGELHRQNEFLLLFKEQLRRVSTDLSDPLRSEIIAARAMTAQIWAYDRITSDGRYIRTLVESNVDLLDARRQHFAHMDHENRARALCLRGITQAVEFLDTVKDQLVEAQPPKLGEVHAITGGKGA